MNARCIIVAALAWVVGCGPAVTSQSNEGSTGEANNGSTTGSLSTGSSSPGDGTAAPPTTVGSTTAPDRPETTSGSSSTGPDDPTEDPCACNFLCPPCPPRGCPGYDPDCGGFNECDIFEQDCPEGEKCMPWANDGTQVWNATRCSPIDPQPDTVGEPCTVKGIPSSGIDSCAASEMCFYADEDNNGTCVSFCGGSVQDPECPEGQACSFTNDATLALCLPACDPLNSACPEGEGCFPAVAETFACLPAPTETIANFFTCHLSGGCEPGTVCLDPLALPDCDNEEGCCTSYCDLADPSCPEGLECLPFFEPGAAPDHENLGLCATPL